MQPNRQFCCVCFHIYVEGKSVCDYEIAVQSSFFIEVLHPLQIEKSLGYFSGEISEVAAEGGVCSFNKKIQSRNHYVRGCGAYQKQKKNRTVSGLCIIFAYATSYSSETNVIIPCEREAMRA